MLFECCREALRIVGFEAAADFHLSDRGVSDGDMLSVMTVEFLDLFRERFAIKGLCCPPSGPASAPRNHANVEARTSEPCRTVEHCRVKAVLYR